jgi:hypothetical protein
MSEILKASLEEALHDEYKARALYTRIIEEFGEIRPFINIVDAESRHIQALLPLFHKYGLDIPEDDWAKRVEVPASVFDACQAGVDAEIENAEMYDRLLTNTADYPDVQAVLKQLQRASADNHLPAFQRCVERGGQGGGRQRRRHHNR